MKVCFFIFGLAQAPKLDEQEDHGAKVTHLYFLYVHKLSYQQSSADLEVQFMELNHRDGVLYNYRHAFIRRIIRTSYCCLHG